MQAYFAASTPEALAYAHVRESIFHDSRIGYQLIGQSAAYSALQRYIQGEDVYIPPRNLQELQYILKSYATDVIHSLISQAVSRIPEGGYSKARIIAATSLTRILRDNDNVATLLALHHPDNEPAEVTDPEHIVSHSSSCHVKA
ncbi:hypothetical protein BOTBODRAFT_27048 [Botryobasidium botryosum FD-172 SS1]|uniref:Uncharacterized protein n=1 Tax=Botryobasidium botryosum (strain FD-172 SS1) TaxID=930990 RepID=A0A067N240_BOTB1|nr:hypothetical protein BOTBODRAFT_27048 [Botryobasidium botryosum FD-172 SS1]